MILLVFLFALFLVNRLCIAVNHGDLASGALDGLIELYILCSLDMLGHKLAMLKEVIELLCFHALMDKQVLSDLAKLIGVLGEDLLAVAAGLVKDVLYLFIDKGSGLLGVALGLTEVTADEDAVAGAVVGNGAKAIAHAVAHDHVTGDGACLLNIAGSTCGNIVKEELFSNTSAKGRHDACIVHRARAVIDAVTAIALADVLATRFGTDWLAQ